MYTLGGSKGIDLICVLDILYSTGVTCRHNLRVTEPNMWVTGFLKGYLAL